MSLILVMCILLLTSTSCLRFKTINLNRNTAIKRLSNEAGAMNTFPAEYLDRLIANKKFEVNAMLRRHQQRDDDLVMRMSYISTKCNYNVTHALKRMLSDTETYDGSMSVVVDMKRKSPTIPDHKQILEYDDAAHYACMLARSKVDAILVCTDELEYGGKLADLKSSSRALRDQFDKPPACIAKDVIIHPVQVIGYSFFVLFIY